MQLEVVKILRSKTPPVIYMYTFIIMHKSTFSEIG